MVAANATLSYAVLPHHLPLQAGSLEFLAGQGFNFNKWIYDGVPFMPAEWRDR